MKCLIEYWSDKIKEIIYELYSISDIYFSVEVPKDRRFGHLSTNVGMVISKILDKNPRSVALEVYNKLKEESFISKIECVDPGFINWCLEISHIWTFVLEAFNKNEDYGRLDKKNISICLEYVSANPTGPVHAGHARCAVVGDVLGNLLEYTGYDVTREYYINDNGNQINLLIESVYSKYAKEYGVEYPAPDGGYIGNYIADIAEYVSDNYKDAYINKKDNKFKKLVIDHIINIIKKDLKRLKIFHDVFVYESDIINSKILDKAISILEQKQLLYNGILDKPKGFESSEENIEGECLLFKSTEYGDDMDRVIKRNDGTTSYFGNDVGYHMNKIDRKFNRIINVLGADHIGYIERIRSAVRALADINCEFLICQLVKFVSNGIERKMSKRSGNIITVSDVLDEVDVDIVRFMMLTKNSNSTFDFDFAQVVNATLDNPVFYVQYAHARSHSLMKKYFDMFGDFVFANYIESGYVNENEMTLILSLLEFPNMLIKTAEKLEPNKVINYLQKISSLFHTWWHVGASDANMRIIIQDNLNISQYRMSIVQLFNNVIKICLNKIINIKALEEL